MDKLLLSPLLVDDELLVLDDPLVLSELLSVESLSLSDDEELVVVDMILSTNLKRSERLT